MDEGLDTGPIAMTEKIAIGPDMTAGELHDVMKLAGASLMLAAIAALEQGELALTPQPATGVTYAKKIIKEETRVDWSRPAEEVHNHIRGLSPSPGAWCEMPAGGKAERVKLLRSTLSEGSGAPGEVIDEGLAIACGQGAVRLLELQRAGGKPVTATDFQHGAKLGRGTRLT